MRIRRFVGTCGVVLGGLGLVLVGPAGPAGAAPVVVEYGSGITTNSQPTIVTTGPDGNLWFTEYAGNRIGRMTPSGQATEFSAGITASAGLGGITVGADGNLWFAEGSANKVGRITPSGSVAEFAVPTVGASPQYLTLGSDGNVWFTEHGVGKIGRITPSGSVTEFGSGITASPDLGGITAGPDGNVWFTEAGTFKVAKITPSGTVTEYHTGITAAPGAITTGSDGNLWVTQQPNSIARVTPSGIVNQFSSGMSVDSYPAAITAGPDGALWFTEYGVNKLARITTGGGITEYGAGITAGSGLAGITLGPDGNLWFVESQRSRLAQAGAIVPGLQYHPMVPVRALDSRTATGNWKAPLSAGASRSLTIAGTGSVSLSAAAVVMNVTVTNGSLPSFLTVFPTGSPVPNASNLNFAAGQTIPNLVTVKLGSGGAVSFANAVGSVDVIADIVGYYDGASGSLFTPVTPARILDSRTANGGWGSAPLGAGALYERTLTVRGVAGVPMNATAVALNVTVTGGTENSFLTVFPDGVAKPITSTVNFAAGQTIPNLAVVGIGATNKVRFDNAVGWTDVIVDLVGWYAPGSGSYFHPINPSRVLDDRVGNGTSGPWGAGVTRSVQVGGRVGMPVNATGFVLNTTVTNGSQGSFLTVFPAGVARPTSSNLNFGAGQTIPNLVMVGSNGTGVVNVYNELGSVDVIADAVGYFASS